MIKIIIFCLLIVFSLSDQLKVTVDCIKEYINSFKQKMNPKLFNMFAASYPNTLTTTIKHFNLTEGHQQTYIITGDIEAMWLRDSTNQFLPYMRIPKECPNIQKLARGLINTQGQLIMADPYTNAFKKFQSPKIIREFYLDDKTTIEILGIPVDLCLKKQYATKLIWQRKFQIDSLASFLRLAYEYYNKYHTIDFVNINFIKAIKRILSVIDQQTKDLHYQKMSKRKFYTFFRTPTELQKGEIKPSFHTGMIKTGFRPSDDPNTHPYNIPGNAMMSTYLQLVAKNVLLNLSPKSIYARQASILAQKMQYYAKNIKQSILRNGVVNKNGKQIFAYEVNGNSLNVTFDDANIPSLLSLPYLQFVKLDDPIYKNTRQHILSSANPYYFSNDKFSGIGSSHTNFRHVWPLALTIQILTSNNQSQIKKCLEGLIAQSRDNLIHQSFSIDNPSTITRSWFAWANSLFGEMIITLAIEKPSVLL